MILRPVIEVVRENEDEVRLGRERVRARRREGSKEDRKDATFHVPGNTQILTETGKHAMRRRLYKSMRDASFGTCKNRTMTKIALLSGILGLAAGVAAADNWPAWRGSHEGSGGVAKGGAPREFSADKNLLWKIAMPGYGWVFPLGDGTINVGAGVMSSFKGWKDVNTNKILGAYVDTLPEYWGTTRESSISRPIGGKLPMSFSVGPKVGPNWISVGDAAGAVNPFNGEGIDYAYETGRMAADYIADAIATDDHTILHRYTDALETEYGDYHRVARAFVIAIGNPVLMRRLTRIGLRSRPLMEWVLKVMANLLEPEEYGMSERVFHAIEKVVKLGPEPKVKARAQG